MRWIKTRKHGPLPQVREPGLLLEMSNSPRTRKTLMNKGAMRTPEDEKEVMALKAIAQDLSEGLSAIKSARSAAKSLAFGESMKKKRSKKTVSKLLSLDRCSISKSIEKRAKILTGEEACWLAKKQQTRCDALSEETKKLVYDFWAHSASRPTGNKNDVMRKRVE